MWMAAIRVAALVECPPRSLSVDEVAEECDFPAVYAGIPRQRDIHALLELPLRVPALEAHGLASVRAMYYGTLHWRPLVNGFSAHFPPAYEKLEATCCYPMPDPATLIELEEEGVTHILVHR